MRLWDFNLLILSGVLVEKMRDFEFQYKWYCSQIKLSHSLVQKISESSDITDALMSGGGAFLVASGVLTAPLIAVIASFIKLELVLIKRFDKGKGVYLTSYGVGLTFLGILWIPSSVK